MIQNKKSQTPVDVQPNSKFMIGIAVAPYYSSITNSLLGVAKKTLIAHGVAAHNIIVENAPGAFELPLLASMLYQKHKLHAVICIGCVIKGETNHDEYINHAIASSLAQLSIQWQSPFVFGVLTVNNMKQAKARSGNNDANKGREAALAALGMLQIKAKLTL